MEIIKKIKDLKRETYKGYKIDFIEYEDTKTGKRWTNANAYKGKINPYGGIRAGEKTKTIALEVVKQRIDYYSNQKQGIGKIYLSNVIISNTSTSSINDYNLTDKRHEKGLDKFVKKNRNKDIPIYVSKLSWEIKYDGSSLSGNEYAWATTKINARKISLDNIKKEMEDRKVKYEIV